MKTDLFYYTGTGNSLWTARMLGSAMGDAEIIPISNTSRDSVVSGAEAIGIIFPVHIWGLPRRVIAFVDALEKNGSRYYFAIAVNAGQVAATLIQLKKRMQARGLSLSAGFELAMPSNYIPWGGPGPKERQIRQIEVSRDKIGRIAASCAARKKLPVEKGPLWQNIFFTGLNRLSFSRIPMMDRSFWVDEKCNGCGICKSICPSGNIDIPEDTPIWLHHCEQCLACIQWCPQEAIQFGRKTPRYKRYHHPEITLRDMLSVGPTRK
ncbi:MAG: EFR1 family ferrodoxin [Syntrophales bacterium]|jgi:ferredoxin|nr:EFR1 family ferrodoxin [Syntrophales bacterium]